MAKNTSAVSVVGSNVVGSNIAEKAAPAPTAPAPDLMAELAKLRAENEALRKASATLKVSEKGAVSFYGTGRYPVSLYPEQWAKVLDKAEEIKAFIRDNATLIAQKQEAAGQKVA